MTVGKDGSVTLAWFIFAKQMSCPDRVRWVFLAFFFLNTNFTSKSTMWLSTYGFIERKRMDALSEGATRS